MERSLGKEFIPHEILEDARSEREQRVQQQQSLHTLHWIPVQFKRSLGQSTCFKGLLGRRQCEDVVMRPSGEGVEMSDDLAAIDRLAEHDRPEG